MTSSKSTKVKTSSKSSRNPSISEIRIFIEDEIKMTKENRNKEIIIQLGIIHKKLNMTNAMATVCSAMKSLKNHQKGMVLD